MILYGIKCLKIIGFTFKITTWGQKLTTTIIVVESIFTTNFKGGQMPPYFVSRETFIYASHV